MDIISMVEQWKGQEIVAFCGSIKYRGTLENVIDGKFFVLSRVAIMNPAAGETAEYETCILNADQVSGLANKEIVGRGEEV
ncbi:MAG: hypothetical protein CVT63_06190 [Candidatus Anoxymicrobium japonicum]|uniref:Uncharacterized protein n=1 Tax=Candidatus Anoxymicrobium japonicum TaxID=2013648 RepID=A0A2N3G4Z1_9ACTN|nr:MAG: hypothetical protein CVT63_06190 [Candidatus Anoxymicrobium japonicum]